MKIRKVLILFSFILVSLFDHTHFVYFSLSCFIYLVRLETGRRSGYKHFYPAQARKPNIFSGSLNYLKTTSSFRYCSHRFGRRFEN